MKYGILAVICCLAVQLSCDLETVEFPTVTTLDPLQKEGLETTFMGRIHASDLSEISEYGFAWSDTTDIPQVGVDESMMANDINIYLEYSFLTSGFTENVPEYHVRAYIVLRDSLKYGDPISFSFQTFAISMGDIEVYNDSVLLEGFLTILEPDRFTGVIDHGHVISEDMDPTITDMRVSLGSRDQTGGFESSFILDYNTMYYTRAYAITDDDTIYTPSFEIFVRDGWNQLTSLEYPFYFGVSDSKSGKGIVGLGCNFLCSPAQEYTLWSLEPEGKDSMTHDRIDGLEFELENNPRQHGEGFIIGDEFYFGLGVDDDNEVHSYFYSLNLTSLIWDYTVPEFPGVARANGIGLVYDGKAYVGFGVGPGVERYSDLYMFDPATGWSDSIPNPFSDSGEGVFGAATAATDDAIYVIGGNRQGSGPVNTVYEYRPDVGTWKEMAPFPGVDNGKRYDAVAFAIDGKVYVGSGTGGNLDKVYSDFHVLDPATNIWSEVTPFGGVERFGAIAFVIDGKTYIGSGQDRDGRALADMWIYTPDTN